MNTVFTQTDVLECLNRALVQTGYKKVQKVRLPQIKRERVPSTKSKSAFEFAPTNDDAEATLRGQDRIELTDCITGQHGRVQCFFCQKYFNENQAIFAQVASFRSEHVCHSCAKSRRLVDLELNDHWDVWG